MSPEVPANQLAATISLRAGSPPSSLSRSSPAAVTQRLSPIPENSNETEILALLCDLDSLQKQYNDTLSEMHSVKSTLGLEMMAREAAETTCADLEKDKQRLLKSQLASYKQAAQQLDYATKYTNSVQSLTEIKDKIASLEKEHEMKIATLCARHERKEEELNKQIIELSNEALSKEYAISCLEKKLARSISPESHNQKIQDAQQLLHDKYRDELGELKTKLEKEEMNNQKLQADLQEAQHTLTASKVKYDDQLRELSANRHADVFKQKVMKLRKDNEMLRRQIQGNLGR